MLHAATGEISAAGKRVRKIIRKAEVAGIVVSAIRRAQRLNVFDLVQDLTAELHRMLALREQVVDTLLVLVFLRVRRTRQIRLGSQVQEAGDKNARSVRAGRTKYR